MAASRRVAGTRRVELEIGGERHRVEIELPVEHPAATRNRIAFRPRRWKAFSQDGAGGGPVAVHSRPREEISLLSATGT